MAEAFREAFPEEYHRELIYGPYQSRTGEEKYRIDLWRANELVLLSAGVRKEHIHVTNICTRCNPELLWSHRLLGTRRGNLAAFLSIKDENRRI